MTAPISLSALRAAHEAATPGEWDHDDEDAPDSAVRFVEINGVNVATVEGHDNAAAIVAAHNAMPALLAVVEVLKNPWIAGFLASEAFDNPEGDRLRSALTRFVR